MRRQMTLGVVFVGLSFALAIAGGDAINLDGKYKVVSLSKGGKDAPADIVAEVKSVVIKDGTFTVDKMPVTEVAAIKIDASKSPAQIDVRPKGKDEVVLGIFKVEKDTLTIVVSKDARPTSFDGNGKTEFRMVLSKVKE